MPDATTLMAFRHLIEVHDTYTPYDQIPRRYIDQYHLDPNSRYIYRDNSIYQVNPRTRIIQQILSGLIR